MAAPDNLGVRWTPILEQLFDAADRAVLSDLIFPARNQKKSILARYAIDQFHQAVFSGEVIDWERFAPLYLLHLEAEESEDGSTILPRSLRVYQNGKDKISEVVRFIEGHPEVLKLIPYDPSAFAGVKVPKVEVLIYALQYLIDRQRAKSQPVKEEHS